MKENKAHFDITPHIVTQLGEQLVTDEITALLELVKNSYDADASYVSIEISTSDRCLETGLSYPNHTGYIMVEDDGFGMSEETIMKSWLVISFSHKRIFKNDNRKTPKGRTPLGDKGLGRLSTQRLADICEIFSNETNKEEVHIAFDWRDFEKEEILSKVPIKIATYPAKKKSGTKLILTNLKHVEIWNGNNLERFKGQIAQIISPYKENRPFDVYIKVNGQKIDISEAQEDLRNLAISRFEFIFDRNTITVSGKTKLTKFIGNKPEEYKYYIASDNGEKFFHFLSEKYDYIISSAEGFFIEFKKQYSYEKDIGGLEIAEGGKANPGPFRGKIDEYSYDNMSTLDDNFKQIFSKLANYREFAQNQVGIKIFRNGFAVKPFGFQNDDWLRLGEYTTSGASYYALKPKNVIGYFSIDEGINHNLKDKTDREGLISNPYSRNFFTIAYFIKDVINQYQEHIRRAYNEFLKTFRIENSGIKTVTQALTQLKETKEQTNNIKHEFTRSVSVVNEVVKDSTDLVKRIRNEPLFFSAIEKEAGNEIEIILKSISDLKDSYRNIEKLLDKAEKLDEVIDILEPKIQILEEQLVNFSELASVGLIAESISHEFSVIADRLAEKSSSYANKLKNKKLTESDQYVLIEYITTTINGLKIQLKHLDPTLRYNKEKKSLYKLSTFFDQEKEYYNNRFDSKGIKLKVVVISNFSIKVNRGKLIQIIDNLISNSEYWLIDKKKNNSDFKPTITIKIESPYIYIYDNGYGVAPAIENQIFEPFVTTKPKGQGRGLGLFIVQQLLDSLGCTIALEPDKNQQMRKYIFAINLSNIMS